jgi:hypothetical protein
MAWSFVSAPLTVLTGGQALERVTNWGGFVMVIRTQWAGLEGFFEKNGKKLPVAGQCLRIAMATGAFSEGGWASPKLRTIKDPYSHARYDQINVESVNEYQAHPK